MLYLLTHNAHSNSTPPCDRIVHGPGLQSLFGCVPEPAAQHSPIWIFVTVDKMELSEPSVLALLQQLSFIFGSVWAFVCISSKFDADLNVPQALSSHRLAGNIDLGPRHKAISQVEVEAKNVTMMPGTKELRTEVQGELVQLWLKRT